MKCIYQRSVLTAAVVAVATVVAARRRETEVELFEDNPSDYILRDVEGSNSDTR